MTFAIVKAGTHLILFPDGRQVLIAKPATLEIIRNAIGKEWLDMILLDRNHWQVLCIGDFSALDGSEPNALATQAMVQWRGSRASEIFGIAVITNDRDFADDGPPFA